MISELHWIRSQPSASNLLPGGYFTPPDWISEDMALTLSDSATAFIRLNPFSWKMAWMSLKMPSNFACGYLPGLSTASSSWTRRARLVAESGFSEEAAVRWSVNF